MNPRVSAVMPAYNAEKTVRCAIESVLGQTYTDFELIVIDDCSSDNTFEVISAFAETDSRVKACRNKDNSGVSATRNFGVGMALGEYIAFIDSDDMWREDKLELQMKLMTEEPDCPLSFTGSSFLDAEGKAYDYIYSVPERVDYRTLLKQNVISCSSVIVKREIIEKYPMKYDQMHEDFATWLQILRDVGDARAVNEPLLHYRIASGTKSSNKIKSALMAYRVYRFVGLNFFQTMYYMPVYTIRGIKKYSKIKGSKE